MKYEKKIQITQRRQKWGNGSPKSKISKNALNVNSLSTPIKRQRFSEWILKNHAPTICFLQETHSKYNDLCR